MIIIFYQWILIKLFFVNLTWTLNMYLILGAINLKLMSPIIILFFWKEWLFIFEMMYLRRYIIKETMIWGWTNDLTLIIHKFRFDWRINQANSIVKKTVFAGGTIIIIEWDIKNLREIDRVAIILGSFWKFAWGGLAIWTSNYPCLFNLTMLIIQK